MYGACGECGVPRLLSFTNRWKEGCIVDTTSGGANLCIYEASYPGALMEGVKDFLGIPIDRFVFLAGMHAAVKVLGEMFQAYPFAGKLLSSRPLYRLTERLLIAYGRTIGVARVEVVERRRGARAKVRIHEPFDLSNCLAIIAGLLQVEEGHPMSYRILEDSDPYLVDFYPSPEDVTEEEAFKRLVSDELAPIEMGEGELLDRCARCGAPRGIGDLYDFDIGEGIIRERAGGERVVLMGMAGLNSFIRELGEELGQDIDDLFIRTEKASFASKLAGSNGRGGELWGEEALRSYLALRGLGFLQYMREEGGECSFTVGNAFIAPIVAGRLLALWEMRNRAEAVYDYAAAGPLLSFAIRRKG